MTDLIQYRATFRKQILNDYLKKNFDNYKHDSEAKKNRLLTFLCSDFDEWEYVGGEEDLPYWCFKSDEYNLVKPDHQDYCGCSTRIAINVYVRNVFTNEVIVVGRECMKRFMNGLLKKCFICSSPHKNRLYDVCNSCGKIAGKWKYDIDNIISRHKNYINRFRNNSRISSRISSVDSSSITCPTIKCDICRKTLKQFTSNTDKNPGRKFYSCRFCNFFKWDD